jgi:NADPH:quinone reductase-like Zn-dependent oxidoreductase
VLRLGQIARPGIGDREVLLRVHAAGVDRGVWPACPTRCAWRGTGSGRPRLPCEAGKVAGRVQAVGGDVTTLAVDDEVFGIAEGSFAEYARARAGAAQPMPMRGAPVENGVMGRSDVPEGATMDGHGRGPSGQRGCHHAAGERERLAE